jgi:hypothetical protein
LPAGDHRQAPGIDQNDQAYVFDRLYRATAARAMQARLGPATAYGA